MGTNRSMPISTSRAPPAWMLRYQPAELRILPGSPADGRRLSDIAWPPGCTVVAITQGREIHAAHPGLDLHPGERAIVLAPTAHQGQHAQPLAAVSTGSSSSNH